MSLLSVTHCANGTMIVRPLAKKADQTRQRMAIDLGVEDMQDHNRTLPPAAAAILGFGFGFAAAAAMMLAVIAGYAL